MLFTWLKKYLAFLLFKFKFISLGEKNMQEGNRKLAGSYLLDKVESLKKELETKEQIVKLFFCDEEIVKALEREGLKVENYHVIIDECVITKI